MKHQYEDYIEFCDKEIAKRKRVFEGLVRPIPDQLNSFQDVGIASLLANRDTLKRHAPRLAREDEYATGTTVCSSCIQSRGYSEDDEMMEFPCETYTDITKHLDLVMGASND